MRGRLALMLCVAVASSPSAQQPADLEAERREFARWLETAPLSPYAILALQPVGPGITIGPEPSDIPLAIESQGAIREDGGTVALLLGDRRLPLPKGRPISLEGFRLLAAGPRGRTVVAVYNTPKGYHPPTWYSQDPRLSLVVRLTPPERRGRFRILGLDGIETEVIEAGFVRVVLGSVAARWRVYQVTGGDADEPELLVFFRDGTSGKGTYPAGRFVELAPEGGGQYRLDLNRARNPFCAYSTVYPCPAPWPGNTIDRRLEAGERYEARSSTLPP